jgi:two-component system sensor histidine kinase BaeS
VIVAFVGVAALATLIAAMLTARAVDTSFEHYLQRRLDATTANAISRAQAARDRPGGGWSPAAADRLAHELEVTGYDFRLVSGGAVLVDTTRLKAGLGLRRAAVAEVPPDAAGGRGARLEVFTTARGGQGPAEAEFRSEFDRAHMVAAVIAAVIAAGCGLLMAGPLTRSLRRLAAAAARLAGGDRPQIRPGGPPEVRVLGAALSGLASDLDRQARARRQLAEDLAHELRTPLTLIQTRIEGMQDGVLPTDAEGLEALRGEVLRLTRLISQIERLASAEGGATPLVATPLDLAEIATEIAGALGATFPLHGLRLSLEVTPAIATSDPDATRQIFTNLISNATKYVDAGGEVVIRTGLRHGSACVEIEDSGPAMSPEVASRVFERSYRATASTTGEGIGLAIARELAEAQGGRLVLEVAAPGNRFRLELPAALTAAAAPGTRPAEVP